MKYTKGLHKGIRKGLKLFKVEDISKASMKALRIEKKSWPRQRKKIKDFKKGNRKSSQEGEQCRKHINTTQKISNDHCKHEEEVLEASF